MSGKRSATKTPTAVLDGPAKSSTPAPANDPEEGQIDLSADIVGIEELQNHGINVSDIQKLKGAGIHSISVCTW